MSLTPGKTGSSCSFMIWGDDFDPNAFSKEIGVEADEMRMPQQGVDRSVAKRVGRWELRSSLPADADVGEHVREVLDRVRSIRYALEGASGPTVGLAIALYLSKQVDPNPGIHFSPEDVVFLAEMGSEIDVDIYLLE